MNQRPKSPKTAIPAKAAQTPLQASMAIRQQKLRADMRSQLITAGLKLFKERGFDATTVDDIVAEVGISQRTFFRYFDSKDDLPFVWVADQGAFVKPALAARPVNETPWEATRMTLLALSDWHDSRRKEVWILVRLIFGTPSLFGRYKHEHDKWANEMIRVLQDTRGLPPSQALPLRVQVSAAITTFVVALQDWATGSHRDLIRPCVEVAFDGLEAGLSSHTK